MPLQNLTIVATDGTWVVRAGGAVIGQSQQALELTEGNRPGVIYFPREDLGMAFLERSDTVVASATLGEARYFGIVTTSGVIPDVAWTYEVPRNGAERIAGMIAFDSGRVAVEEI